MPESYSTLQSPHYSELEAVPPGLQPVPGQQNQQNWGGQGQFQKEDHYQRDLTQAPGGALAPNTPNKQTILGLSVRRFWAIVIILVVVLAAGIGGGIGGGLAARSQAGLSSPAASSDQPGDSSSTSPHTKTATGSTESSPTGSSSSTTQTESPTTTTRNPPGATSPAPTDGCPNNNGTSFSPLDAEGKAIPLGAGAQSFLRLCNTNWPGGATYGNPGVHDIMKVYVPSLEDCITACASYNINYQANADIGAAAGGLCRAVSIVKKAGEYCYLKNATGKVDFRGDKPEIYSSALLLE